MSESIEISAGTVCLAHGPITYLEAGRGRPLMLLHGVNGGARSWMPQLRALGQRFRVIAWNAPGYDASAPVGQTISAYAQAGLDLLDALECERVPVVGHSLGGIITMQMLALQPQRFTRALLSCTHPGYGQPFGGALMERYARRLAELENLSREDYGRLRATRMLPPDAAPEVVEALAAIAARVNPKGLEGAIRALATADLSSALPQIRVPTLVLTCDRDPVVSLDRSRPLIESIPDAHHVRLPGLGHAPYFENPELFNSIVELFLDAEPPAAG